MLHNDVCNPEMFQLMISPYLEVWRCLWSDLRWFSNSSLSLLSTSLSLVISSLLRSLSTSTARTRPSAMNIESLVLELNCRVRNADILSTESSFFPQRNHISEGWEQFKSTFEMFLPLLALAFCRCLIAASLFFSFLLISLAVSLWKKTIQHVAPHFKYLHLQVGHLRIFLRHYF